MVKGNFFAKKGKEKMIKEIITIIILIVLIVGSSIFAEKYLLNTSNEIIKDLEELENKLELSENIDEIFEDIEKIQEKWNKIENKWAIIVEHGEIDKIELSILQLEGFMKHQQKGDVLANINQAKFLLKHIVEMQKIKMKNVF